MDTLFCPPFSLIALSPHHEFTKVKQVIAFAGLTPAPRESGQWRGNTHIAKNGDAVLCKALYMPAIVAWGCNPLIKPFCERLKANGKNGKAIVCEAMRKLIHIAFGLYLSQASVLTQNMRVNKCLTLVRQDGSYDA